MTRARDLSKFANSQAFSIDSDFQVGINSTVPAATLDVRGDSVITGVLTATSFSGTVDATGLTGTPDITVNNIVGAAATFSGVVTYEDVTNVDSVGVITARSDVNIADSIIHLGDTNTKIRFPANDTITFETAGNERFRIESDGGTTASNNLTLDEDGRLLIANTSSFANASIDDLVIGDSSSSTQRGLTIGSTDECAIAFADAGDSRAGSITYNHGSNSMIFKTSGQNERLVIASNGVVTAKNGAVAEIDTLTSATSITPDFAASCNFTLTLGHNVTLNNPSNLTAGQTGSIFLVQDGTGSRTLTFGSYYDFAGGTAPTISTAASSVDRLDYIVRSSTSIHCVVTLAYS